MHRCSWDVGAGGKVIWKIFFSFPPSTQGTQLLRALQRHWGSAAADNISGRGPCNASPFHSSVSGVCLLSPRFTRAGDSVSANSGSPQPVGSCTARSLRFVSTEGGGGSSGMGPACGWSGWPTTSWRTGWGWRYCGGGWRAAPPLCQPSPH